MGLTGAMTKAPKCRYLRALPIAIASAALLIRVADAQSTAGFSNQPTSQLGDTLASGNEPAEGHSYGIDAGIGETNNVTLAPTHEISQTMAIVDADFAVRERSRLFDVNATGNFSYLDFLQHAYGNELLGRFDGLADAAIIPERLIWTLRDDFGQSALDPYTPVTPGNIENINYLTTGPDLNLRFGGVNFLNAGARYARVQFQTSPFDSNRVQGNLSLGRQVSAGGAISLNANTEKVMFDNTAVSSNFESSSGFGRYEIHGARTDLVADLGATAISQSAPSKAELPGSAPIGSHNVTTFVSSQGGSGSSSGSLARLELSRRISPAAKLTFTAGRNFTDASSSFSAQSPSVTGQSPVSPAALTSASYRATYASASWQYQFNRTTLAINAHGEKDVYPSLSALDRNNYGVGFSAERRLTRNLTARILGNWAKTDYPVATPSSGVPGSTDYANSTLGASLAWRHGRGLEIRLRCSHDSYSVANGNTGYRETRAFLTVGYRPTALAQIPTEP
jgi:hypothetical protein